MFRSESDTLYTPIEENTRFRDQFQWPVSGGHLGNYESGKFALKTWKPSWGLYGLEKTSFPV